ncbi:hypothetical protein LCGC14_1386370 [marine sediment metagenome]|uniref:DUF1064 domain-containing protein n=1 Tax=marine sediment metagenome TaxID=412755 RepID=A0A0F9N2T8_9ZZZZ
MTERMGFETQKRLIIDHHNVPTEDTIGGKHYKFRSKLERNWAAYLQFLKESDEIYDWRFEQTRFTFPDEIRGVKEFLVDFDILHNDWTLEYYETKGWLQGRDVTKFKRVVKYRPEIKIVLVMATKQKKDASRIRQISKYAERVIYAPDIFRQVKGVVNLI